MSLVSSDLSSIAAPPLDPAFVRFDPRSATGVFIKNHRGRRDVLRIRHPQSGKPVYLKRTYKPYFKDVLRRWWRFGRFVGTGETEAINAELLENAGVRAVRGLCYGSERGWLRERFTFVVCEGAEGDTLDQLLIAETDRNRRRALLRATAQLVARMHEAGLAFPDLFGRHVFVTWSRGRPELKRIDVYRVEAVRRVSLRRRARDLAALNISIPRFAVTHTERLRLVRDYQHATTVDRDLVRAVQRRGAYLLTKRKHVRFNETRGV